MEKKCKAVTVHKERETRRRQRRTSQLLHDMGMADERLG